MKQFAPEYSRDEHGWILFPKDADYRKQFFPPEANEHQAKANIYLVQSIIEYVSEPCETILDVMSGTGTLIIGALIGRPVICIEISEKYHNLQKRTLEMFEKIAPGISTQVSLINMPCQIVLPIPDFTNHIIFSPPYASIMKSKGTDKFTTEQTSYDMNEYTQSPLNLGHFNDFLWAMEMEKVYKKCYESLRDNGTITVIVKDHYEKQKSGLRKRIELSMAAQNACLRVGFKPKDWFKWKAPGSIYTSLYRSRGWDTVDDEDIIILSK